MSELHLASMWVEMWTRGGPATLFVAGPQRACQSCWGGCYLMTTGDAPVTATLASGVFVQPVEGTALNENDVVV